jgi:DNA replication and repair protein RecF
VHHGAAGFHVWAEGRGDQGPLTLEVRHVQGEGKEARLNGAPAPSLERLRSAVATLVFTPDRLAVVKAAPAVRRAYADRVLARLYPARAQLPTTYAEALAQRNAALQRIAAGLSPRDALAPWDEGLATAAAELSAAREATIAALSRPFSEGGAELGLADAELAYEPSVATIPVLEERLERDLERGRTGVGPHRDEVRITAGAHDLRTHGSQGEQRLAVLALLLAEAQLLAEARAVPPLLLLDDVLSELDGERRSALVARLAREGQTLITTTAREALRGEPDQALAVTPGRVMEA